ncbi:MAG: TrkH family potassium uptake protein [Anaerolineales bacterium]|nr:TrkH family potassium uptake protein [Anaerolineales bacterium]
MLLALPFALYYGEGDAGPILSSSGITAVAGFGLYRWCKPERDLRPRDAFAIVSLGWILISAFGTLPFLLSGSIPNFTDAFFETVSGFTTTGATILPDIEAVPHGVLFWRSTTHWMGGMGIIVFSLAVLPFLGVGGMQLFKAESAGPKTDKLTPRVTQTAKILWGVYVLLTGVEAVLLLFGGMSLFDALANSFGTVASGGFSTQNASIAYYRSPYIDWVITFFMVLAGTNFALHYRFLTRHWDSYWRNAEWRWFIGSLAVASLLVGVNTFTLYADKLTALRDTVFTVVSLHTSTGFATANYEEWAWGAQFVLLLIMIIGGSVGSTSGGVKVLRVYLVFKAIGNEFTRAVHPQAVTPVRMLGVTVQRDIVMNVLVYFSLYMMAIFAATLVVAGLGMDWISGLSAVVSCLGGVGPGMGSVGPFDNYAWIHPLAKWVLIGLMLLGRLEFYSLLILLAPAYWRK